MQTFSDMQRISSNPRIIARDLLWLIPLVIYESLGTIYYMLPPLIGFFVALLVINKKERYLPLALIYLLFVEADHGLFICSTWIFLIIFDRFIVPIMEDYIISKSFSIIFCVVSGYALFYMFIYLVYFLFGIPPIPFSWLLAYYAAVEAIFALVVLQ